MEANSEVSVYALDDGHPVDRLFRWTVLRRPAQRGLDASVEEEIVAGEPGGRKALAETSIMITPPAVTTEV